MLDFLSELFGEYVFSPPKRILRKAKGNSILELLIRVLWSAFLLLILVGGFIGIVYLIDAQKDGGSRYSHSSPSVVSEEMIKEDDADDRYYEGLSLPEDVHMRQILTMKDLPQGTFALVYKHSLNVSLGVPDSAPQNPLKAGILKKGETSWEWLLEIRDSSDDINLPKNNPLDLFNENGELVLAIMDATGAGSGEGIAKLFTSRDMGKTWAQELCGYYSILNSMDESYDAIRLDRRPLQQSGCNNVELIVKQ